MEAYVDWLRGGHWLRLVEAALALLVTYEERLLQRWQRVRRQLRLDELRPATQRWEMARRIRIGQPVQLQ